MGPERTTWRSRVACCTDQAGPVLQKWHFRLMRKGGATNKGHWYDWLSVSEKCKVKSLTYKYNTPPSKEVKDQNNKNYEVGRKKYRISLSFRD